MQEIKELVKRDKFEIIPRDKNINFMIKYCLNKTKAKNMILSLEEEDLKFQVKDRDYLKYGPEPLVICVKNFHLVNMHGQDENISVYIKIKMTENNLPVVSFHVDKDFS